MTVERDRIYLKHILECAGLIQNYTRTGKAEFTNNPMVRDATLRRLQIMAESSQRLSEELKAKAPGVDWRALAGFRNILVHDYLGGVDLERVWDAIAVSLPELAVVARDLLDEVGEL